jgi:hypothetical protein
MLAAERFLPARPDNRPQCTKFILFRSSRNCHKWIAGVQLVGDLMFVSDEEAAAMYARWCRNWYGVNAKSVVKSKIRTLMAKGDRKGLGPGNKSQTLSNTKPPRFVRPSISKKAPRVREARSQRLQPDGRSRSQRFSAPGDGLALSLGAFGFSRSLSSGALARPPRYDRSTVSISSRGRSLGRCLF